MKRAVVGIFAQVDAGKTTLSEALLYLTGQRKTLGRVDKGSALLDHFALERSRGITIFSKQARLKTDTLALTLLDTPGHVDFSPEAERVMPVLDYALLLVSGTDGVQAHTETLWKLLRRYHVPTVVFFNKMDLPGADKARLLADAKANLSEFCAELSDFESIAMADEAALDEYLRTETLADSTLARLVAEERCFPCLFGAALQLDGVNALLRALERLTVSKAYPAAFSARVYKISRDAAGNRLTFLKVTGGTLHVRDALTYSAGGETLTEKATQLRLYSGAAFTQTEAVEAGDVCAVTGLSALMAGQTLGAEEAAAPPLLTPVMLYRLCLPPGTDAQTALPKLRQLEEEEPQLHLVWDARLREIHAQIMGQVQLEVLQALISERFGLDVAFDRGRVAYRETIAAAVEGVGHFEPLRHYAEVHLLLEPLPRGSGLELRTACAEDALDRSWQRLILTHLEEKQHLGVLTGSPITDLRITLVAGRAHVKHTEGGDFRQATYRAVRQGLMQAQSILLEPYYRFRLTVPPAQLGRAINDLRAMGGSFGAPEESGEAVTLEGRCPVSAMHDYMSQVAAYTHGRGKLRCLPDGYDLCRNAEAVIAAAAYDPEADVENTPDSVFCSHGAGVTVKWNEVFSRMHLALTLRPAKEATPAAAPQPKRADSDEAELERIIEREFGPQKRTLYRPPAPQRAESVTLPPPKKDYLIVDGYNMIFAWDGLREQAQTDISGARERLLDLLSNYCSFHSCELVVVFDSYRVKGGVGSKTTRGRLRVVYTRENESADLYIESLVGQIGKNYTVRVATSDAMIQLASLRSGVLRVSARELLAEIERTDAQIAAYIRRLHEEARRAAIQNNPLREQLQQKEEEQL